MALKVEVPPPTSAKPVQVELCGVQWLLERRSDGVRCVATDGGVLWEGMIGLPGERVRLELEARPVQDPIELTLTSEVVLASGGRVRGWVTLPLELRLLACGAVGGTQELVALGDGELRTGWREEDGYYHPYQSALHRAPRREWSGRSRVVWVRMFLENRGETSVRPDRCRLDLSGHAMWLLRGLPLGPRVNWRFGDRDELRVLPLPGLDAGSSSILAPNFRRTGETAS